MDDRLRNDLNRFFRVYQNNAENILRSRLPSDVARTVEDELDEEFQRFKRSILNRLKEEFR